MKFTEKRKICFYGVSTHLGGAERSLFDLVKNMDTELDKFVLMPATDGPLLSLFRASGIRVQILPMPAQIMKMSRGNPLRAVFYAISSVFQFIHYGFELREILKKENPDVIHCTGVKCHLIAAFVGASLKKRVLWHIRDIFPESSFTRSLLRSVAKFIQVDLIFNSIATQKAFLEVPFSENRLFRVIYNGLPADVFFHNPNLSLKNELKVPGGSLLVVSIGVLARWKGQLEFVEMANHVLKVHPNVRFAIIGEKIYDTSADQDYARALENKIQEYGLKDKVSMIGFRKNVPELLNSVDLLVHTSIRPEPFGRVILEAMACGVPVVATRGGGVDEFVIEHHTGLLASAQNVNELVLQVKRVLEDPKLRQTIIAGGRDLFMKKFTIENHVREMKSAFEAIFSKDRMRDS